MTAFGKRKVRIRLKGARKYLMSLPIWEHVEMSARDARQPWFKRWPSRVLMVLWRLFQALVVWAGTSILCIVWVFSGWLVGPAISLAQLLASWDWR